MRKTALFHGTAFLLITLAAILLAADAFAEPFRLKKPGTGSVPFAAKQAGENAFPEDKVGLAAYVLVDQPVDIRKLATAFGDREITELGENHIVFDVLIENFSNSPFKINLYADTSGWIISYLRRGAASAGVMQWKPANMKSPSIRGISRTTLSDALIAVGDALQMATDSWSIKYYHFNYPDANRMTIAVKTVKAQGQGNTSDFMQVLLPRDYTFYELSYYHYAYHDYSNEKTSYHRVDGQEISKITISGQYSWHPEVVDRSGVYPSELFTPGTLHTVQISMYYYSAAGVATVAIYKEP